MAVADNRVFRIAGDEQHLELGAQRPAAVRNLPAVHAARQPDVGDQQIDRRTRLQQSQRLGAVTGLQRPEAQLLQRLDDQRTHVDFVIHHQHHAGAQAAVASLLKFGGGHVGVRLVPEMARQVDAHRRAHADFRIHPDLAAGLPCETVDHRQAESGAHAHRLGREEGFEHALDHVRRHAGAGVGHAQRDVLAGRQVALAGDALVHELVGGLDGETSAIRHRVAGVDTEIEQRVFELVRIDVRAPQPDRTDHFQRHGWTDGAAKEFLHAGDELVDVDGFWLQRLPARKREHPVGEGGRAFRRALRHVDVALEVVVPSLVQPALHQFEAAGDAGQQVVEVVRQPTGELADGFHLLRLPQLLLHGFERSGGFLLGGYVAAAGVDEAVNRCRNP